MKISTVIFFRGGRGLNYVAYHVHSDFSLLDSCTKFKDYVDKAVEYGQSAIGFAEHGNIYNWLEKKMYCDKQGIKYIHGCEVYLTESHEDKVRDNYHAILISKNLDGFYELNSLIDLSTTEKNFYYKPRLSFDEFLNISDNIIKISACVMSPLNRLDKDSPYYEKLAQKYDYYEIQPHLNFGEQVKYNKYLYELSKKYGKKLIVGTDSHSLNSYKAECRLILQKAKSFSFKKKDDKEDSNENTLDLTYKSYDELVEMFKQQGSLPEEVYTEAINNTNVMADSVEDLVVDMSYKYPTLSENDERLFKERINQKYQEKLSKGIIDNNPKYKENIKEEFRVLKKIGMLSFLLFMSELTSWCRENNIPYGPCRGSVGGSTIAYMLDIIDLNPVVWNTVFSRFANEDRVEIGDIDIDFAPSQREKVYDYIIKRFGINNSAYILAIGTISDKGTIDEIGRALEYPLNLVAQIKKEYDENKEDAREKYKELFYYFDGLLNTAISQSMHPAGIVASPVTLPDKYGTFWKDGKRILQIDMDGVHEVNLVKYDILGLKNIEIIKDTYELVGSKYLLSHEIDWEDKNVWDDIITSPVGLFQFEGKYAFDLLKQYVPQKVNDLSIVNAALRPSGASYRDRLIAKEFNKNPSEQIDELLKDNNGFLIFQEDTIKFLQDICGLSGSEADNIRRAIGRKQRDRLEKAMPDILEGYCNKSNKPREVAEEEAKAFLQIIDDSASYQFGFNHSTGYSMIGYICGYLRYHYPLEFVTAYLNNANNEEDIYNGTELARSKGIAINPIKFRKSKAEYTPDKETNSIFKGIASIKFLNTQIAEELYQLKDKQYTDFYDLLIDIKQNTSIDSRQLQILTTLNFFSEFGKNKKLLTFIDFFDKFHGKKQCKKDKIKELKISHEFMLKFSRETDKSYMDFQSENFLKHIWSKLKDEAIPVKDQCKAEFEYLGYIQTKLPQLTPDYYFILDLNTTYTPRLKVYQFNDGTEHQYKIYKKSFKQNPLEVGDIIKANKIVDKPKNKLVDGEWVETGEMEQYIINYSKVGDSDGR